MTTNYLELIVWVQQKDVSTVLEVLKNTATLKGVRPVTDVDTANGNKPRKIMTYKNGVRRKPIKAETIIVDFLRTGPKTRDEIGREMEKGQYSAAGALSYLSKLGKRQLVERLADGKYQLV